MKKINILLILTALLFAINSAAEAKLFSGDKKVKAPGQKSEHVEQKKPASYVERLNLTPEQKDFYQQIRHSEYEQLSPIVDKIRAKHQELERFMASDIAPMAYKFHENAIKQDLIKLQEEIGL